MECLVTKYKGVSTNGNLPSYNTIDFIVTDTAAATDDNYRLYIQRVGDLLEATIIGNGAFRDNASMDSAIADKTISAQGKVRFTPGNYKIRLKKKQNAIQGVFNSPTSMTFDLDMFKYNQSINNITINGSWADLNALVGNLNKSILLDIDIPYPKTGVYNISLFNNFVMLRMVQVYTGVLQGDVKDWVVAQVKAGRTTNSDGTDFRHCLGLSFNGTQFVDAAHHVVTWEPATGGTAITLDGTTIIVDANGNVIG